MHHSIATNCFHPQRYVFMNSAITSTRTKRIAILQSNYIPWKGYFDIIRSVDDFVIYDDVQFTKKRLAQQKQN